MTPLPRMAALALVLVGILACGEPTEVVELPRADEYTLVSHRSIVVPGVVAVAGDTTASVLSGSFFIAPDGSCAKALRWSVTRGEEVTEHSGWAECSWLGDGNAYEFSWDVFPASYGTVLGDTLQEVTDYSVICITWPCPGVTIVSRYVRR